MRGIVALGSVLFVVLIAASALLVVPPSSTGLTPTSTGSGPLPATGGSGIVTWTASEYCASDAQPGLSEYVVPTCARGVGYGAPPVIMYNATRSDSGTPVWMSAANNSSGEVVVLANSVLTQPSSGPLYDYPTMWAYLPGDGWVNLTDASGLGDSLGTLGYDLARAGGCMAWDPQERYFLTIVGQNKTSSADSNFWSFTYTPGTQPLPGGTWVNRSAELTGWNTTSCEMAWYPPSEAMILD